MQVLAHSHMQSDRSSRPALRLVVGGGRTSSGTPPDVTGPTGDAFLESLRSRALPVGAGVGGAVAGYPVA